MYIDQHLHWIEARRLLEARRGQERPQSSMGNLLGNSVPHLALWATLNANDNMEERSNSKSDVTDIQPNDVLFGRGKSVVEHEGNLKFRNLVAGYGDEFDNAGRLEKTQMTEKIVQSIAASGGRFLKRDEGGSWEEVEHEIARKKVAHAFRNRRKLLPHAAV